MAFLIYALGFLLSPNFVFGNFSYDGSQGPTYWGNEYKTCLGKYQSPINIEEKDVTPFTFPDLQFSGIQGPHTVYMTNNGHTVMLKTSDSEVPMISGGPMNDTYVFQQLHFHWGQTDELGSEDLINNQPYSMELHAVFWKKEYGSPEEAMKHSDGLTVLGYLYQANDKSNPDFELIVSLMPEIEPVDTNVTINDGSLLSKLVAPDLVSAQGYFTYKGSLTTPPCLEIVQWIDFEEPLYISHDQLTAFRSIHTPDGTNLTHNFRPVQPLDGRIVYRNSRTAVITSSTSGAVDTKVTPGTTIPSNAGTTAPTVPKQMNTPKSNVDTNNIKEAESTTSKIMPTTKPMDNKQSDHSGKSSLFIVSPFTILYGIIYFFHTLFGQ